MRHWEKALIGPEATFRDALISIDATGAGIALIADADRRLLGVLSDGDLRRALIRGAGLEDAALSGANREPFCIDQHQDKAATLTMLRVHGLRQLPVLDAARRVIGLTTISDFLNIPTRTNPVVIMAGGKGSRLAELTRDTPKPMLKVGPGYDRRKSGGPGVPEFLAGGELQGGADRATLRRRICGRAEHPLPP